MDLSGLATHSPHDLLGTTTTTNIIYSGDSTSGTSNSYSLTAVNNLKQ